MSAQVQEEGGRHEETRANSAHEDQNMQQESDMSLAIATTILSNESSNMSIQISQDSSIEVIEKPGSREETRVNEAHAARLKAMEPIICMLKTPVKEGKWTHSDEQCVRKVFFVPEFESLFAELVILDSIAEFQMYELMFFPEL